MAHRYQNLFFSMNAHIKKISSLCQLTGSSMAQWDNVNYQQTTSSSDIFVKFADFSRKINSRR